MGYLVKLEVFEGPFDLLLNLIERAQIDIMDIPIAQITEDYLAYLHQMQELDLVISGDFLVMAATLLQIKAKMLLPKRTEFDSNNANDVQEHEDPREELVQRLLEYKLYKEVAAYLKKKAEQATCVFPRIHHETAAPKTPIFTNPVGNADVHVLAELMAQVLAALKDKKRIEYINRKVSVAETIASIRLLLMQQRSISFSELLIKKDRYHIICTFLAVLELVRMREVRAYQEHDFGEIQIISLMNPGKEVQA